ncbi:MAG: nicotinamide-nucleotide amidohydrolase family protein [Coriobacteriia bacterium]
MRDRLPAAIVTVGTELVTGQRLDTNTSEIAFALLGAGYAVSEAVSVPDDIGVTAATLARLTATHPLVVVTGGLGPTHDDITREAAARALGRTLVRDPGLEDTLASFVARQVDPRTSVHVLRQADIVSGARVLPAIKGTAPGQVIDTAAGELVLLPGPPAEMRPILAAFIGNKAVRLGPVRLRCVGLTESDVQLRAQAVLGEAEGIGLTVLASPALVEAVLFDEGGGEATLSAAGDAVADALGDECYSRDGASLAEVVVRLARATGARIATAESCTGGMVAAALTDIPGASDVVVGGVVAYSNDVKMSALGVPAGLLAQYGAVSGETARAMAEGALGLGATLAVSTTGVAGPSGGSPDKPVGLVWIATAGPTGSAGAPRRLMGDRAGIRTRATVYALDALRRALTGS